MARQGEKPPSGSLTIERTTDSQRPDLRPGMRLDDDRDSMTGR